MELEVIQTEHGLAGQLEVGHRDCNLLVVTVPGHDFYHVTLIFGPLSEAEHGQSQHVICIILFLYLEGERATVAGELAAEEKTVHSDRGRDSQTAGTPGPAAALLIQETQGSSGAGGHAASAG